MEPRYIPKKRIVKPNSARTSKRKEKRDDMKVSGKEKRKYRTDFDVYNITGFGNLANFFYYFAVIFCPEQLGAFLDQGKKIL